MKTKEKVIIIVCSLVIGIISYLLFFQWYYSLDTYRIESQGYTDYALKDAYIRDGRLFLALIIRTAGTY